MRKAAFTLAEVLITLGIIGVVVALTITPLIQNYQKKSTVAALKAAYSIFSQAVAHSVRDNGDISDWEYSYSDMAPKYIFPYVDSVGVVKKYKMSTLSENSPSFLYGGGWVSAGKIYALKNGMTYSLIYDHGVLMLTVDINGAKGPNRLGRDGFVFQLLPKGNKLVFSGAGKSRNNLINDYFDGCIKRTYNSYYAGQSCGALIMLDGWKIAPDYPW